MRYPTTANTVVHERRLAASPVAPAARVQQHEIKGIDGSTRLEAKRNDVATGATLDGAVRRY